MLPVPTDNRILTGWRALPPEYAIPERAPSLHEAQQYCSRLAHSHYENFSVVTWFLPKRLHQHFYNVYAYCRISDDLGDEVGNPEQSLALMDEWESELNATYFSLVELPLKDVRHDAETLQAVAAVPNRIGPRHPVFVALRETIRDCDIPREPFADLLTAFRQDQTTPRYSTFNDVAGLLPLFGEPRRTPCPIRMRLPRCPATDSLRLYLHCAATGELLAGRGCGLR